MTTKRAATAKQNRKLQWVRLQQHDVGGADVWACSDCKHAFATSVHAVGEDENSSASTTTADTADTAALADTAATLATTSGSRRGKSFKDIKTVRSAVTLLRKAAEREKELKRTVRALTEAKQMALDGKQKSKKAAAKQAKLLNKLVNENLYIACEKRQLVRATEGGEQEYKFNAVRRSQPHSNSLRESAAPLREAWVRL
jgi:hypothetical protein